MAPDYIEAAFTGPFRRDSEFEHALRNSRHVHRRDGDGDKRVEEHSAVVINGVEDRSLGRVRCMRVPAPVRVHRAATVMRCFVIVRMRMNERCRRERGLERQRQRNGNHFPHDVSIVRACLHAQ